MFRSWQSSWTYNAVHLTSADSQEDLKDGSQRDSLEAQPLAGIPHHDEKSNTGHQRNVLKRSIIAVVAVTVILGLVMFLVINSRDHTYDDFDFVSFTHVSSPTKTNDKPHICGNSSAEARELGCTFNQLMWTWFTPNCPQYANEEFLGAEERPWVYYEDLEQKKVVQGDVWDQVLDGELRVFGERREHVIHCVFLFLSLAQIMRDGTPYYAKLIDYEHSEQCTNMILDIVRKELGWNELQTMGERCHLISIMMIRLQLQDENKFKPQL